MRTGGGAMAMALRGRDKSQRCSWRSSRASGRQAPECPTVHGQRRWPASFARVQWLASLRSPRRCQTNSAPRAWPPTVVGELTPPRLACVTCSGGGRTPGKFRPPHGPRRQPVNSRLAGMAGGGGCSRQPLIRRAGPSSPPLPIVVLPLHLRHFEQGCCS